MSKINVKIKNLIRNPCTNFLSYLYKSNGWKRVIFGTSKECYIPSYYDDLQIRIVITETKTIMIEGNCIFDVLIAMEFIEEQFKYSRMSHYLVDDCQIDKEFTTTVDLSRYGFFNFEDDIIEVDEGIIILNNNIATITCSEYENVTILKRYVIDVFNSKNEDEEELSTDLEAEMFVLITLFFWGSVKLLSNIM